MKAKICVQMLYVLALLGVIPTGVFADMIIHQETGLEFWIPDSWKHRLEGDLLVVEDPSQRVKLFFLASGVQVPDQGSDSVLEEISRVVGQPELASVSSQQDLNGLLCYFAEGFGLYEGEIVDWDLIFVAGARKSMMIIALGDLESAQDTMQEIYETIQPTKLEAEG